MNEDDKATNWINVACDLEDAGRFDEARALVEANTTEAERLAVEAAAAKLGDVLARVWADKGFQNFRAARADPSHPRSEPLLELGDIPPGKAMLIARHLPPPARPGRPARPKDRTRSQVEELSLRLAKGDVKPTAAARAIAREAGERPENEKKRADYLVKVWKQQNK
jgi:hypothetical protein